MTLIADGLLLAAALAAIFYCWAVQRRLGALQAQSSALTERLAHLDTTVAEVRAAISEGRLLADAERDRLGNLVQNADKVRRDLKAAAAALENRTIPPSATPAPAPRESSLERVKRINRAQSERTAQ